MYLISIVSGSPSNLIGIHPNKLQVSNLSLKNITVDDKHGDIKRNGDEILAFI